MQLGIELLVLPARRPQWNGLVERINRTVRTECWNHYRGEWNCRAMNERMDEYIRFYNNERPHHSLGMKTPAEAATICLHELKVRNVGDPAQGVDRHRSICNHGDMRLEPDPFGGRR